MDEKQGKPYLEAEQIFVLAESAILRRPGRSNSIRTFPHTQCNVGLRRGLCQKGLVSA